MGRFVRWMCIGALFAASASAPAEDGAVVPRRTIDGTLDARARLRAVHAEMRHECGASPASARCHRLQREFRQETKNYQKRHPK